MPRTRKDIATGWLDPDDAPELTDDFFDRAETGVGDTVIRPAQGTLTRRGRPKLDHPKRQVTVRLDGDLIDRLRASGPGWQSRMNAMLRKAVNI
jgi:uncharacterized protein (DUF4415 family)